jgi:hypothetical protein
MNIRAGALQANSERAGPLQDRKKLSATAIRQPVESPCVVSVAALKKHRFSKEIRNAITLLAGTGVEGDALT